MVKRGTCNALMSVRFCPSAPKYAQFSLYDNKRKLLFIRLTVEVSLLFANESRVVHEWLLSLAVRQLLLATSQVDYTKGMSHDSADEWDS